MTSLRIPPFHTDRELVAADWGVTTTGPVPNEPCLDISELSVNEFLRRELSCNVLDELYPHLHLIATKSSAHIAPLYKQIVNGRSILIAERPSLHLIWHYNVIFVKPIPHCLLNAEFWARYLHPPVTSVNGGYCSPSTLSPNCRAALGFLRTYAYLIRHESDFRIAKSSHLLPDNVSYREFQLFIQPFRRIPDEAVTCRYHYGQLRLTRLNWAVRIFQPASLKKTIFGFSWSYQNLYLQTGQFLERFGAPLLFLFAGLTIILSSMQVVLAARPEGSSSVFATVSWGFSVAVIIFIVMLSVLAGIFLGGLYSSQLLYGIRVQRAERENEEICDPEFESH
jgi:hypothetical protein